MACVTVCQGLFRNHGEAALAALKPHLDRLSDDMSESAQKCLCEMVAGERRPLYVTSES